MQRKDGQLLFSPHDLINFMQCEFITWMDRRYLDDRSLARDEDDAAVKILQEHGLAHETKFLESLISSGNSVATIESGHDAAERTLAAMRDGYDVVFQAALQFGEFAGIADFLYKADGASSLGDYHYQVFDTKLARQVKPEFVIQLCCYADLLEQIQGKLPEQVGIVLGSGETERLRTRDYFFYYRALKNQFLNFIDRFDSSVLPDDIRILPFSRWNSEAERILQEQDSLLQVANIRRQQVKRLRNAGIASMQDLADSALGGVPKMSPDTFAALKQQARLQIASRGKNVPDFEIIGRYEQERRGLALLPPADDGDIWFDMEGYPHMEGGLEYLFGAITLENGKPAFTDFWAHDRAGEKLAFEQFVDWIYDRWQRCPNMHVYHYASYEVTALKRLMGRHGTREDKIDELLRNNVFVDLYQVVRQGLRVGEPSYSIKYIEHLYRPKRAGNVATAVDSIVFYEKWLNDPDGESWKTSATLAEIREYNRLDCESTLELNDWLRLRQTESGCAYVPPPEKKNTEEKESSGNAIARRNAELATQLLDDTLAAAGTISEEETRIRDLIAALLQFHQREQKPFWWSRFNQLEMTQEELIDDVNCLGGLQRTGTPARVHKTKKATWHFYEYAFDSGQETKLAAGATACLSFDSKRNVEIVEMDSKRGLLVLKLRAEHPEPVGPFGLLPADTVTVAPLQTAIYEIASQLRLNGALPRALLDFFERRPPRIKGKQSGETFIDTIVGDFDDQLFEVCANMQSTTLCIQGPPGCGKTTSAAKVIARLLAEGKRIGITSNSHKSIEHLLNCCVKAADSSGVRVNAVKVSGDADRPEGLHTAIEIVTDKKKCFPMGERNLIGGTAYVFCIESASDSLDYLFVDEAGQVPVANLMAMSRCARNIILLGDPMQLEQPTQGFHPGESGLSTLEYYMHGHATIAPDKGVFLGLSYRMHPDVCDVVSDMVYEGRLRSSDNTCKRVLSLPSEPRFVEKPSGVLFVPVAHEGNTQGSEEEVDAIKEIVAELLQCGWFDGKQQRALALKDILVVTPYNVQVRNIGRAIADVRVGTVDKFQGQEAAVAILSMCSSDASSSPRGVSFLFDRHRLNVAISRAMTLAIVVGAPKLAHFEASTTEQMALANFFCKIVEAGSMAMPDMSDATKRLLC